MTIIRYVSGNTVSKQLGHDKYHLDKLLEKYNDILVGMENAKSNFYSDKVHSDIDKCDLEIIQIRYDNYHEHNIIPYTIVSIDCPQCDGNIRLNSRPSKIKLFVVQTISDRIEITFCLYEEELKKYNPSVLAAADLYIIKKIDEFALIPDKKIQLTVSDRIKKLLPFT